MPKGERAKVERNFRFKFTATLRTTTLMIDAVNAGERGTSERDPYRRSEKGDEESFRCRLRQKAREQFTSSENVKRLLSTSTGTNFHLYVGALLSPPFFSAEKCNFILTR
jgi:hypothetical protein